MKTRTYLKGMIAGASVMYFLDPERGARRRGLIRDRFVHLKRKLRQVAGAAGRDARNRYQGLAARTRRSFLDDDAPDAVIRERVRSGLGRAVSHPGSITVEVRDGRVTLSGPVLADEVKDLLAATRRVPGVNAVEDRLDVRESADDLPGLQGEGRLQERSELRQESWTPALRMLMGGLGAAALLGGKRASGVKGAATSAAGGALLARAATNLPARRLVGVSTGREAVRFQKSIHVDVPVEDVWALWSRFENFPRFMAHLEEVSVTDDRHSHWVARGPAGSRVEWDAEITEWEPKERIAWESTGDGTVRNAGQVRFQPDDAGGTRVDVHLWYNPPAGAVGHAIASLFGSDPKHAMDEDMVRLKSLLELGKASVRGETVTVESLEREAAPAGS